MKVVLSNPRGFCAGVERAITIVKQLILLKKQTIYVYNKIVHNENVIENLEKKGVKFVNSIDYIPNNSLCVFSAHGVSKEVEKRAAKKNLQVYDATCPLVKKVHLAVEDSEKKNLPCILIGHKSHPEILGTSGRMTNTSNTYIVENMKDIENLKFSTLDKLKYSTQTTLSLEDTENIIKFLKIKYPNIQGPKRNDICYATQNRQNAIKKISKIADIVLIVGSKSSSNANRLYETSKKFNRNSYFIENASKINMHWFRDKNICGLSSGASTPEHLVEEIIFFLRSKIPRLTVEEISGVRENISFKLPKSLGAPRDGFEPPTQ